MDKIVLPKLSYKIMSILFKIHTELGPFLLEKYYQRALELELTNCKLKFKREVPIDIMYDNKKIGNYLLDFLIEDLVIIELKAQKDYSPIFYKQTLAYLRQTNLPLGIIANFRSTKLTYRRIINPTFKEIDLSSKDLSLD